MSRYFVVRDATQVGHDGYVWGGGTRIAFEEDRGLGVFTVEGDTHDVPLDQAKADLDSWIAADRRRLLPCRQGTSVTSRWVE